MRSSNWRMINWTILLFFLLPPAIVSAKSDWDIWNLHGRVKVAEVSVSLISSNGNTNRLSVSVTRFSEYGYILETDDQGERTAHEYDRYGHETLIRVFSSNDTPLDKTICKYDRKGRHIRDTQYDRYGGITSYQTHWYDGEYRETETVGYDSSDAVVKRTVWEYDRKSGNLFRLTTRQFGDEPKKEVVLLDGQGRETNRTRYVGKDSVLDTRTTFLYDSKGSVVQEVKYSSSENRTRRWVTRYEYDRKGNPVKSLQSEALEDREVPFILTEYTYTYW